MGKRIYKRVCAKCGSGFLGQRKTTKYCSNRCRIKTQNAKRYRAIASGDTSRGGFE